MAGMCFRRELEDHQVEPKEIEVIVPGHRRPQAGFRLRTCRNLSPRDIVIVDRIPVTSVARTLVDLSDDKDTDELAFMIHEAAYLGIFSFEATRAAMARANGRRNLDRLEAALELHRSGSAGTRSKLEKRFRRLVKGAGLPAPRSNVDRQRLRGRLLLARARASRSTARRTSGRGRRSTTGSATPRCGPRATSCCASRGRPQLSAPRGS